MTTQADTELKAEAPAGGTPETKETTPETDWKAEAERLGGEISKLEQRAKSAEGRLKGPVVDLTPIQAELNRLAREVRRGDIKHDPDLEPEAKKEALSKLTVEEQTEAEAREIMRYRTHIANRINTRLEKGDILPTHPTVVEALAQWGQARTRDAVDAIFEEIDDFVEAERDAKTKATVKEANEKAENARKEVNAAKGTLQVGAGAGAGAAGVSEQELVNRYGRGESLSIEDTKKAHAGMAKGLYPKAR